VLLRRAPLLRHAAQPRDRAQHPLRTAAEPRPVLERRRYQAEPERFEYKLTDAGRALYPAIITIMRWGDEHLVDDGPPVVLRHTCGAEAEPVLVCAHCHERMDPRDVTPEPGPGARPEPAAA
jgi:hypothetical protein